MKSIVSLLPMVLADVMMPRRDGLALLQAMRAEPGLQETPVILLTARAGQDAAVTGLLAGADDYIAKPFSARELVARVGGQIALAPGAPGGPGTLPRADRRELGRRLPDEPGLDADAGA